MTDIEICVNIFVILFLVLFLVLSVISIVLVINGDKRKYKSLEESYHSMDGPRKFRVDRLRRDLEDNDIPQYNALEIAIKLEAKGWRKTIDFGCLED